MMMIKHARRLGSRNCFIPNCGGSYPVALMKKRAVLVKSHFGAMVQALLLLISCCVLCSTPLLVVSFSFRSSDVGVFVFFTWGVGN